jgi:leucyl-tRNA synthetase
MTTMNRYDPKTIELKWQQTWEEAGLYKTGTDPKKANYYCLTMFPYPSGDLHTGHWYAYCGPDIVARYRRMQGHNVLHPFGFDAFGLPAENAAIKRNIPPATWTYGNIETMIAQLKLMGPMYDWDKRLSTCDPDYYRWTQWLFLLLYKQGLAYREKGLQNWCPSCQTVLANEQVVGNDNRCERCDTPVVKKELEQWFFRITDYADRLLQDAEGLDWPERVKTMQANWIGRSKGALLKFKVANEKPKVIEVFTTRPDTLFGATYMVLAPEHPLVGAITTKGQIQAVQEYVEQATSKTELDRKTGEKEKTGVFTGAHAINPVNEKKIPIWIADYVLMGYGTGAIMAVPAHDQRDYEFAQKHELPIIEVVEPSYVQTTEPGKVKEGQPYDHRESIIAIVKHWSENKYLALRWKEVAWGTLITGGIEQGQTAEEAAKMEIREETGYLHAKLVQDFGKVHGLFYHVPKKVNRYAHAQALLFELEDGKKHEIDKEEKAKHEVLWLSLSELEKFLTPDTHQHVLRLVQGSQASYGGEGIMVNSGLYDGMSSDEAREKITADLTKIKVAKEQTNYKLRDWLISRQRYWGAPIPIIYCEKCGTVPVPEKDLPVVLPEDVDFQPTGQSPLLAIDAFVRVKCPECGGEARRETDTMDTFVDSSWYFLRYPDPHYEKHAYNKAAVQDWLPVRHYLGGIEHAILHLLYARFITKVLADHDDLGFEEPFLKLSNQGVILGPDGQKMSKSKGNVVNPDEQVVAYGADAFRTYLMFTGPWDQGGPFNQGGIAGTRRFLERVWALVQDFVDTRGGTNEQDGTALARAVQTAARKVTKELEGLGFNTAIAALMEATNELYRLKNDISLAKASGEWRQALQTLLQLLAPFAPHMTEELWDQLGNKTSIHLTDWPTWDEELLRDELMTIVVQVNGKVREQLLLPADADEAAVVAEAKTLPKVDAYLQGKDAKKTIYVPGKLINFVV